MPRKALGPRLYFDSIREQWVIRDGRTFIRTGTGVRKEAEKRFVSYMEQPIDWSLPIWMPAKGFIYFISAEYPDFPIKIGFTQKMNATRLKDLQVACPYPLRLLANFAGGYKEEGIVHRQFRHLRLEGEWFRRSPDLMEYIGRIESSPPNLFCLRPKDIGQHNKHDDKC